MRKSGSRVLIIGVMVVVGIGDGVWGDVVFNLKDKKHPLLYFKMLHNIHTCSSCHNL